MRFWHMRGKKTNQQRFIYSRYVGVIAHEGTTGLLWIRQRLHNTGNYLKSVDGVNCKEKWILKTATLYVTVPSSSFLLVLMRRPVVVNNKNVLFEKIFSLLMLQ